jgi:hypothetical protein
MTAPGMLQNPSVRKWLGGIEPAYGWPEDISADDALSRLLTLNFERPHI